MAVVVLVVYLMCPSASASAAVRVPSGFFAERVLRLQQPTAMAFTPDRELLVATKLGRLLLLEPGARAPRELLDLRRHICGQGERGLVGLAVDPRFRTNRFLYVYFTSRRFGCRRAINRVSRFVLPPDGRVNPASERVLLDNITSPTHYHVGGDLEFGKDGYLYVSVGDGSCHYLTHLCTTRNTAAREDNVLLGKILRIDRNGRAPNANGGGRRCALSGRTRRGARCREIYAKGLRNPFRIAFDPNASRTRFFIDDVGEQTWEEVDVGRLGADYGWNLREGRCRVGRVRNCGRRPRGLTDPIYTYLQPGRTRRRNKGCEAITGGAFVPRGAWPKPFSGDYLFGDYICGRIFRLERTGGRYRARTFATGLGLASVVHLRFGPGPSGTMLYYTSLRGAVWRIGRSNRLPLAQEPKERF
jgi:glucose/arabinose dehydrogenase